MNHRKDGATIYDIAHLAKVSPATVSRVLSNAAYPVSDGARKRVLAAADRLHYASKGKPRPSEQDVVVMLPNLSNPFYVALLSGLETSLRMFGFNTLLMNTKGDVQLERQLVNELSRRSSLKTIISPVCDDLRHLQPLLRSDAPLVVMELPSAGNRSTICINYAHCGEFMTQYFIERGMRRIAYLGAPLNRYSRIQTHLGYRKALEKHGIAYDEGLVFLSEDEPSAKDFISPYHMGMRLFDRMAEACRTLPEAVFCGNDMTAIGVLHRLQELGIRVPEEISVAGFDNIFTAAVSSPPLTTVDQCIYEMGSMAAEILYGSIMDPTRRHVNTILEPKLVIRETVR